MGRGVDLKVLGDLQVYENVETVIAMSVVWDNSSSSKCIFYFALKYGQKSR